MTSAHLSAKLYEIIFTFKKMRTERRHTDDIPSLSKTDVKYAFIQRGLF